MTKPVTLEASDREWLKQELSFQIDMERSRLRFSAEKFHEQINKNIAITIRILGALADAE